MWSTFTVATPDERHPHMKKVLSASIFAAVAVVLAACQPSSSGTFQLSATGVQFNSGKYTWLAFAGCDGVAKGYDYSGSLKDTAADGNAVFVHAKVDGYGYAPRIYNSNGNGTSRSVSQSNIHASGSACYHESGRVQVCQDRGTLFPDVCTSEYFTR